MASFGTLLLPFTPFSNSTYEEDASTTPVFRLATREPSSVNILALA